jgi:AraC family transcriptional regulator
MDFQNKRIAMTSLTIFANDSALLSNFFMHHTEKDKQQETGLNLILEYIHCNINKELNLDKLASLANYSPFHFQRLFKQAVGESPKQYIIRLRLERVAHYLKVFPDLTISELSYESGFASLSTFSRAFKAYFGITPEEYRKTNHVQLRKIGKTNDKKSKTNSLVNNEFWSVDFSQTEIMELQKSLQFGIKRITGLKLAFVSTCLDKPDAITTAFRKLCKWAEPRELISHDTKYIGNLLDIPFITPIEKCRYRACITIPEQFTSKNNSGITEMSPGTYGSYEMKGNMLAVVKSLVCFRHGWLENSGYELRDITGYEMFSENPAHKPAEQITREILIPIKSA